MYVCVSVCIYKKVHVWAPADCGAGVGLGVLVQSWDPDKRPLRQAQQLCSLACLHLTSRLSQWSCCAVLFTRTRNTDAAATEVTVNCQLECNPCPKHRIHGILEAGVFTQLWLVAFRALADFWKCHGSTVSCYFGYNGSKRSFWLLVW